MPETAQLVKADGEILVVDDNLDDQFLLERWLRKKQIPGRITALASAEEARAYLEQSEREGERPAPALILLSACLFANAGLSLLEWIRSQPRFNRVLILVLGRSPLERDVQHAYDLGANGYFTKQIDFENLSEVLLGLEFVQGENQPASR